MLLCAVGLPQNGQVYVVENNQKLQPLVKTAALSCINPNVWFDHRTWSPGTLTNFASSRRLFKESHQPNRRSVILLFALFLLFLVFWSKRGSVAAAGAIWHPQQMGACRG